MSDSLLLPPPRKTSCLAKHLCASVMPLSLYLAICEVGQVRHVQMNPTFSSPANTKSLVRKKLKMKYLVIRRQKKALYLAVEAGSFPAGWGLSCYLLTDGLVLHPLSAPHVPHGRRDLIFFPPPPPSPPSRLFFSAVSSPSFSLFKSVDRSSFLPSGGIHATCLLGGYRVRKYILVDECYTEYIIVDAT